MSKLKVKLSIGFPAANITGIIEIDDDELSKCETEQDRQQLLFEYWSDWANNYIESSWEWVDDGKEK